MKYRIISVCTIVIAIFTAIVFSNIKFKESRYHQHLEAKVRPEDVVTTDEFATHLPIIKIETDGKIPEPFKYKEFKEGDKKDYSKTYVKKEVNGKKAIYEEEKIYDTVNAKVEYIQNKNKENKKNDTPVFKSNSKFRIRGNSSRNFEKKGYLVEFYNDDYSDTRDIEIDGMVADSDWVLHGPCLDKTLIRNYMAYNIAGEMMDYSPNVRFCELFINNEYMGLYLLTEKIKYNEDGRVNITKTDPKTSNTSYIIKIDRPINDEKYRVEGLLEAMGKIYTKDSGAMEILYPRKTLTANQHNYIEKDLSKIEKTIFSRRVIDENGDYRRYIDVESFVDYYILNEFTSNIDATSLSTYIYRDIRGKVKTVIWDYNSAFDNYYLSDYKNKLIFDDSWWYKYLMKDEYFIEKIIKRYRELRKSVLSDEYLLNYIDETIEYLGPAIERNYKRWPQNLTFDMLEPKERNQHTHKEAIEYLKNTIKDRGAYLDKNIETLRRHSHKSMIQE